MAIDKMSDHLLMQWAKYPGLKTDAGARATFAERFQYCDFQDQYNIMAYMFSHILEPELQYWIMEMASQMVKQKNKNYQNTQFKSSSTMVEFFIRQYSYGETESLRRSIWALMQ